MEALGADPDIYQKLTASVAPSIWQMDDVKKGILCQLFGGSSKVLPPPLHGSYSGGFKGGPRCVPSIGSKYSVMFQPANTV